MGGPGPVPPFEPFLRPPLVAPIAAVVHEGGELGIGDRCPGDGEGRHRHRMGPFLVVEQEGRAWRGAQHELAARHLGEAGMGPGAALGRDVRRHGEIGRRVGQGLAGPKECLGVHVLVEDAELVQEAALFVDLAPVQALAQGVEHGPHVVVNLRHLEERQVPARFVVHGNGIVELVRLGAEEAVLAVELAQDEEFVEIGDVADLPAQRVDGGHLRAH